MDGASSCNLRCQHNHALFAQSANPCKYVNIRNPYSAKKIRRNTEECGWLEPLQVEVSTEIIVNPCNAMGVRGGRYLHDRISIN